MNLYPAKRPKIAQVEEWEWRRDFQNADGDFADVHIGYPYPDYYRVRIVDVSTEKKSTKYFYGEMAHFDVARYLGDHRFYGVDAWAL